MRLLTTAILALLILPRGSAAQGEALPEGTTESGDFYLQSNLDAFTDEGLYAFTLVNENAGPVGSIQSLQVVCGTDGARYAQVRHSYTIGQDNANRYQFRMGGGEVVSGRAILASENTTSQFEWRWEDMLNLVNDPRIAVRITDSRDGETMSATWDSLEGVAEAVAHMSNCAQG